MVVVFTNVVSGRDDSYMEAYSSFIDRARSEGASFVPTLELVEMARSKAS